MNLQTKNITELKELLKKYDLVSNISSLKKEDLINNLRAVMKYKENSNNNDYKTLYFGNKKVELNDEQHKIVTSRIDQNIRVLSCAGSGKTTTIVCRIKYLIDNGIDPERIMLTTFTVDAAESMKKKITDVFGFMPKILVGTLDSIACKFYYKYFPQNYRVSISEYSHYFYEYLKLDDNAVSKLFQYVFVDESQDLSELQFNVVHELYKNGAYITFVGDVSQNIFSFRGSQIKYIINLEKYIKNLSTYSLVNNYRSTPEIIGLANYSIKFNKENISRDMVANHRSINFLPQVKHYDNIFHHNNSIIKKILKYNNKGIEFDEIAILCRNNYPLKSFEEAIEKHNQKNEDNQIKYIALISDDSSLKPKIKPGHVTLTSIHKSKGLEFDCVILLDCNDSRFPNETEKAIIQEERRLFYVAVTRAKKYLYFTFCDEKNKQVKITRFLQEVPTKFYNFSNHDKKYYSYDDYRSIKWTTGVTETLKLLNESDIIKLRDTGILPIDEPVITKLHGKHELNQYINQHYLNSDMGEFIDRYITRSIGIRNNESGGLIDNSAVIIIATSQFTSKELEIYKKYQNNLIFNIKKIKKNNPNNYISILNENVYKTENFNRISYFDKGTIIEIVDKLILTSNKYKIDVNVLVNCFSIKNEIPDGIKKEIFYSHKKYIDADNLSKDIKQDIYKVSLCSTILGGRRRLIYRDVYDKFIDGNDELFKDIELYIESLNPEFTNLCTKKFIKSDKYDIMGEVDLLNIDKFKIIDFKCSNSDTFKLEWLLQLLTYLSIMKTNYKEYKMNTVEIYNPLFGAIFTIDLSNWNKEEEFLAYLYEIRVRQISRASNIEINNEEPEESHYPIDYNELPDNSVNSENTETIEKYQSMINKKNIYDLQKIFGENYNEYYQHLKNKSDISINNFEKYTFNRYMVLDTETIGFPEKDKYGGFAKYTELDKYDTGRMIQICWSIFCNGQLEKTCNYYIRPNGFKVSATEIHGITDEICYKKGININQIFLEFNKDLLNVNSIVAHNSKFDKNIISSELFRAKFHDTLKLFESKKFICTMKSSMFLKVDGIIKGPKLIKLYKFLFGKEFDGQHNAMNDVMATADVFHELVKRNIICI